MMRKFLYAALLGIGLAAAGISGVKTDYDHSTDFSRYHSFAWKTSRNEANGLADNSLVQDRVEGAVNRQLASTGLKQDNRNPDLFLSYRFDAKEHRDFYSGWHRWGWWDRASESYDYTEGTLVIDMTDAKTNHLVWRAYSTNTGSDLPDVQSAKQMEKLVSGALKHFPPEDKG